MLFFCLKFEKLRLKNNINCKIFTLGHCQNQRMFIKDCNLLLFTVEREQKRDYYSLVKKKCKSLTRISLPKFFFCCEITTIKCSDKNVVVLNNWKSITRKKCICLDTSVPFYGFLKTEKICQKTDLLIDLKRNFFLIQLERRIALLWFYLLCALI